MTERSIAPTVKYTTKELLERIEAKVDGLDDIRSKWTILISVLVILGGAAGLSGFWDNARIDGLKTQVEAQRILIGDLKHQLELHTNDESAHGEPLKCFTSPDERQNERLKALERRHKR